MMHRGKEVATSNFLSPVVTVGDSLLADND
jgi:hypothetical protein